MDPATLIGVLLAFGSVFAMVTMEGGHDSAPSSRPWSSSSARHWPSACRLHAKSTLHAFKSLPPAITGTVAPQDSIDQVVTLAEKARSEGLLSLEADDEEQGRVPFRGLAEHRRRH